MGYILSLLIIASVIWVNVDCKTKRGSDGRVGDLTRSGWTVAVILLWIVFFPMYLWQRRKAVPSSEYSGRAPVPASAGPPANWYPDPNGSSTLRWWDGSKWTDVTQPKPETSK
jgi:hypothetical protein